MRVLTLDAENTMFKHQCKLKGEVYNCKDRVGQAFSKPQFLVMTGLKWLGSAPECVLEDYSIIQKAIDEADLVVGYNIKHDLHWLWRVGIKTPSIKVWDCMLAEWLLNNQKLLGNNSLNNACERWGFPPKLDIIEKDYWSKGIDTDEIPTEVLWEYLQADLDRTERIFIKQREVLCKTFT